MKVITVKTHMELEAAKRLEVHHGLGMEQYSDHVFKSQESEAYSATIVVEDSEKVLSQIVERSKDFPDLRFVIDDLDMEANTCERFHVSEGLVKEKLRTGWSWAP